MFPVTHEGHPYICFRDPEGYVENQILLTPMAYFIAIHLDGRNETEDIQKSFTKETGGKTLQPEDVQKVIDFLDEQGMLYTDRFQEIRSGIEENFSASETRQPYLAGKSYPGDREELWAFLRNMFVKEGGPGEHPGEIKANAPAPCLIAPHIDFHRGGHSYAHGYLRFARQGRPDTIFIFGVAHASPPVPFILTKKNFETPFGTLETDQEIVRELENACEWDPYEYEIVHRTEHSIEFQTIMLAYLFGPGVKIVPILCGHFPYGEEDGGQVSPGVLAFLEKCRDIVKESQGRTSVVSGADLAHVGLRFGDTFEIDKSIIKGVESRDREDIKHALSIKPDEFYRSVMKDQNQRRVCGINSIYSALKSVEGVATSGQLLHYDYASDPAGGIVSFANIIFS